MILGLAPLSQGSRLYRKELRSPMIPSGRRKDRGIERGGAPEVGRRRGSLSRAHLREGENFTTYDPPEGRQARRLYQANERRASGLRNDLIQLKRDERLLPGGGPEENSGQFRQRGTKARATLICGKSREERNESFRRSTTILVTR